MTDPVWFMLNAMTDTATIADAVEQMTEPKRALLWQALRADGWNDERAIEALPCWRLWREIAAAAEAAETEVQIRLAASRDRDLKDQASADRAWLLVALDAARDARDLWRGQHELAHALLYPSGGAPRLR